MKKPRIFYLLTDDSHLVHHGATTRKACIFVAKMMIANAREKPETKFYWGILRIIKVQEITNEPRTIKAKASRAKSKTSRPERVSSSGQARHKPRAKAAAGKGKAEVKEIGKGKGER